MIYESMIDTIMDAMKEQSDHGLWSLPQIAFQLFPYTPLMLVREQVDWMVKHGVLVKEWKGEGLGGRYWYRLPGEKQS